MKTGALDSSLPVDSNTVDCSTVVCRLQSTDGYPDSFWSRIRVITVLKRIAFPSGLAAGSSVKNIHCITQQQRSSSRHNTHTGNVDHFNVILNNQFSKHVLCGRPLCTPFSSWSFGPEMHELRAYAWSSPHVHGQWCCGKGVFPFQQLMI